MGGAQSKDIQLFLLRLRVRRRKLEVLRLRAFRFAKRRSAQDDRRIFFDAALRACAAMVAAGEFAAIEYGS